MISNRRVDVVSLDGAGLETHDFPHPTHLGDVLQDSTDATGRTFIGVSAEPSELVRFRLP